MQPGAEGTEGDGEHGQHGAQEQGEGGVLAGDHPVDPLAEGGSGGSVPLDHGGLDHSLDVLIAAVGDEGLPIAQVAGGLILGDDAPQLLLHCPGQVQGLLHQLVPLQQLDGRPVGGEVGGIGVVVEQLAHAVVNVVGEAVVQVVGLKGTAQVHLPVGRLEQLVQSLASLGGDGDHGDAQLPGEALHIDGVPPGLHLVHKVQGKHQGALQLQQLNGEIEVALQIGGVHNVQNGVRSLANDEVPGHDLFHGVGGQGVDPRQIHHRQLPVA